MFVNVITKAFAHLAVYHGAKIYEKKKKSLAGADTKETTVSLQNLC